MRKRNSWKDAEENAAKVFSSALTPGSGCGRVKGDFKQLTLNSKNQSSILIGGYCGEAKSTVTPKLQFKSLWIEKISREADNINQVPAFYIEIENIGYTIVPSEKEEILEEEFIYTINFNTKNKTLTNEYLKDKKYILFDTTLFLYKNVAPIWEIKTV